MLFTNLLLELLRAHACLLALTLSLFPSSHVGDDLRQKHVLESGLDILGFLHLCNGLIAISVIINEESLGGW